MHNLQNIENNFKNHLKTGAGHYFFKGIEFPKMDEKLFSQEAVMDVPYGACFYFIAIENEKPVLYIRTVSRMDPDFEKVFRDDGERLKAIKTSEYLQKRNEHNVKGVI